MKVKKYTANTMREAMTTIRLELGDDAVILNSKEVETGGFLGFFTKKQIEVIAAIDPSTNPAPIKKQNNSAVRNRADDSISQKQPLETVTQDKLLKEINGLKELVKGINEKGGSGSREYPEPFQQIEDQLRRQGVTEAIRIAVLKHLMKKWYDQSSTKRNDQEIQKELYDYLYSLLTKVPTGGITFTKKVINFVGPTGVGKTTTIAKVAAHCVLKKHKKVALITTDTYRIAAVEQLKTYAKILNIPIEVAYSVNDFKEAIEQFKQYDYILVDSAGRNFRNQLYVDELSKVVDFKQDAETYLVLSLTSKYEDMKDIIHQFHFLPINKVILTKKDETSTYGAMVNIPIELEKGIAYVTTGQNVPDDIVEASITYVLDCLFEVNGNE
jgi:flagellar biosynthesis protein FlhF